MLRARRSNVRSSSATPVPGEFHGGMVPDRFYSRSEWPRDMSRCKVGSTAATQPVSVDHAQHQRRDQRGSQGQGQTNPGEVGESIAAEAVHHQVGLVSNRCQE